MVFDSAPVWYVMAKPEARHYRAMYLTDWASPARGPRLLHWTVMKLGRWADLRCDKARLLAALGEVAADPFVLRLDRAEGDKSGTTRLAASRVPAAVRRLRAAVAEALSDHDIPFAGHSDRPHVTLDYAWQRASFRAPIEPIPWLIRELVLVESVTGEARHVEHGRFSLRPRQGNLFPLTLRADAVGTPAVALR